MRGAFLDHGWRDYHHCMNAKAIDRFPPGLKPALDAGLQPRVATTAEVSTTSTPLLPQPCAIAKCSMQRCSMS